jgi:hypothetical protein
MGGFETIDVRGSYSVGDISIHVCFPDMCCRVERHGRCVAVSHRLWIRDTSARRVTYRHGETGALCGKKHKAAAGR